MSRYFDLTHPLNNQLPSYPGDPPCKISPIASIGEEGFTNYLLETGVHAGTHVETPAHVIEGGKFLADYPLPRFTGRGVLVEAEGKNVVSASFLEGVDLREGDIVLVRTGTGKLFGTPEYFTSHPAVRKEFAERLIAAKVKMLALDTPNPDRNSLRMHELLLGNDILIVENVARMERFPVGKDFTVFAFPLNIHADASPVRLVARIDE